MASTQATEIALRVRAGVLAPGLHLVATPIGTARDITLRALDVLNTADLLAAEDSRVLRHLMELHGVPLRGRRLIPYHEHSGEKSRAQLLAALREGASVVYASDAGTPLVADPGYRLVRDVVEAGVPLHVVPGPSAVLAALSLSGLATDRFVFLGFVPNTEGARRSWLEAALKQDATTIFFESPRRVSKSLAVLCEIAPERGVVICREITKKFEEVLRGSARELTERLQDTELKGEIVMLLERPTAPTENEEEIAQLLSARMSEMSLKDAVAEVARVSGLARRQIYQMALEQKGEG